MVHLIAKITSRCNLMCSYCYYMDFSDSFHGETMSPEVLDRLIQNRLTLGDKNIRFIWHGGEPLLAGMQFFEEVVELEQKYRMPEQRISNSIQTNGTLLSTDWITRLKELGFGIGVSLDGPKHIHDSNRRARGKKGSFEQVLNGIQLLQESDFNFGILCVVTKHSLPYAEDIYRFFTENGIKGIDFLPHAEKDMRTGNLLPNSISSDEFGAFLTKILGIWLAQDDKSIRIRTLENVFRGLLGGDPHLCRFSGTCSSYLTIEPNGDVYPDDNFIGTTSFHLGNLLDQDLRDILNSERYKRFAHDSRKVNPACAKCVWFPICKGGCPYRRYMLSGDFESKEYFCETWKQVFSSAAAYINDALGYVPFLEKDTPYSIC